MIWTGATRPALLPTIGGGLAAAVRDEKQREVAIVTFLVTASGLTLVGVGSAFWGLVAGGATMPLLRAGRKRSAGPAGVAQSRATVRARTASTPSRARRPSRKGSRR